MDPHGLTPRPQGAHVRALAVAAGPKNEYRMVTWDHITTYLTNRIHVTTADTTIHPT